MGKPKIISSQGYSNVVATQTNHDLKARATSSRVSGSITLRCLAEPVEIRDGVRSGKLVESSGGVIERGPPRYATPVSDSFSGVPYLRKLAGHRIRIKKELKFMGLKFAVPVLGSGDPNYMDSRKVGVSEDVRVCAGVKWGDLTTVFCFKCGKTLLGPRSEYVRQDSKSSNNSRSYKNRVQRALPPKAFEVEDGWSCGECLLKVREGLK